MLSVRDIQHSRSCDIQPIHESLDLEQAARLRRAQKQAAEVTGLADLFHQQLSGTLLHLTMKKDRQW
jgi:hypothetical protein